jgi:hypothetical protein
MRDDPEAPKKRGRPPAAEKGAPVLTWLPARTYDRLIRQARARDESVSACLRRIVEAKLEK